MDGPSIEAVLDRARENMLRDLANETIIRLSRELTLKDLNFVLKLLGSKELTEYPPEVLAEPPIGSCFPWRRR
jgi:hypothetical protein